MVYNVLFLDIIGHNIEKTMRLEYAIDKNDYLIHQLFLASKSDDRFPHKEEFCHFAKITTSFKKDGKTLLPTREELDELNQFEMVFESYLKEHKVKNYYVFRETHRGNRIFYFVTNDAKTIAETTAQLKKSNKLREFDIDILTDKDWSLYQKLREKIPNEQE